MLIGSDILIRLFQSFLLLLLDILAAFLLFFQIFLAVSGLRIAPVCLVDKLLQQRFGARLAYRVFQGAIYLVVIEIIHGSACRLEIPRRRETIVMESLRKTARYKIRTFNTAQRVVRLHCDQRRPVQQNCRTLHRRMTESVFRHPFCAALQTCACLRMVVRIQERLVGAIRHTGNHCGEPAGIEACRRHQIESHLVRFLFQRRRVVLRGIVIRENPDQRPRQDIRGLLQETRAVLRRDGFRIVVCDMLLEPMNHFMRENAGQLVTVKMQLFDRAAVYADIVRRVTGSVEALVIVYTPTERQGIRHHRIFAAIDELFHDARDDLVRLFIVAAPVFRHILLQEHVLLFRVVAQIQQTVEVIIIGAANADKAAKDLSPSERLRRRNSHWRRKNCHHDAAGSKRNLNSFPQLFFGHCLFLPNQTYPKSPNDPR